MPEIDQVLINLLKKRKLTLQQLIKIKIQEVEIYMELDLEMKYLGI